GRPRAPHPRSRPALPDPRARRRHRAGPDPPRILDRALRGAELDARRHRADPQRRRAPVPPRPRRRRAATDRPRRDRTAEQRPRARPRRRARGRLGRRRPDPPRPAPPRPCHRVTEDDGRLHFLHGISPDGATLVYTAVARDPDGSWLPPDLATVPARGGQATLLTEDEFPDDGAEFT